MFVGTNEILFAPSATVFNELDGVAVTATVDVATTVLTVVESLLSGLSSSDIESDSGVGDDGGDVLISIAGAVAPASPFAAFDPSFVPLPFIAELLPNCRYADNLGKMSLAFRISLL